MNARQTLVIALATGLILSSCDESTTPRDSATAEEPSEIVEVTWDTSGDALDEMDATGEPAGDPLPDMSDWYSEGNDCLGTFNCMAECGDDTMCELTCIDVMCEPSRTALNALNACLTNNCNAHCTDRTETQCWLCLERFCLDRLNDCAAAGC